MATIACHLSTSGITTSQTQTIMSLALNILPDLNSQLTITGKGPYLSFLNTELLAANIDTGYKFKIYCNRYNFSSIIFDFTPAWSLYEYNNFIQSITGSEVTTDYSLNRHTGSEFKINCDQYYFFLSYLILIPREPLSNILIG